MYTNELSRHVGRFYGKYRGSVVDNTDETHRGTLVVTCPDVFGRGVEVVAQACLPYGHYFVPPKGADVWVEFEAGDTRRPLWVGAWYTEAGAPAKTADQRVIHTPAGHVVEIDDTAGEERVLVRHASNAFVSIDAKGNILLANAAGSHLHLDAENGTATLVEQHGNHLAMGEDGTALVNPDGTTVNIAGDTVHISAAKVILDATTVAAGSGAGEPTLMGSAFQTLWNTLLTHVHPHAMGPTLTSLQLAPLQLLPGVHLTSSVVVK
ncbi:hypothetical protein Prum_088510 [Phytohabitans rumicis]|uniref:Gp5/Type VI secretion system Vgr protein OB-fold domain-containing protein n=1 Tax=Phytohabitans rumicis TaxID=1076125 RepID=A0A6V8LKP6_9ACTN|nr:hypothetical protein Prum_088510 [Phytohabitans rumicis]